MSFDYITTGEAIAASGVRMTVVSGVPSPWGESAKNILHIKNIAWSAVRLDLKDKAQLDWSKNNTAPALINNQDHPIDKWDDILSFAEKLVPTPSLLPSEPSQRQLALKLSGDFCGSNGLGANRRLQAIHLGLTGNGGFPKQVARYLADKYGYTEENGAASVDRNIALLNKFSEQLLAQKEKGSPYYLGNALSCVDIYSATFCGLFSPLPEEHCKMDKGARMVFENCDSATRKALSPILLEHRDRMYTEYFELPLSL